MSVTIIVTKSFSQSLQETGESISESEWDAIIASDPDIIKAKGGRSVTNPVSGEVLSMGPMPGSTTIKVNGKKEPFLRYSEGELMISAYFDTQDEEDPIRNKIGQIAKRLNAIIMCDASDDIFEW